MIINNKIFLLAVLLLVGTLLTLSRPIFITAAEKSGSIGIEGKISADPPTQAATITFPTNGSVITQNPITVTGLCPNDLVVKIFKNNVFAGSAVCKNGSYSILIDLFGGTNDLIARVYDNLDQAGPDSNKVTVTFPIGQFDSTQRVSLTSIYAKKGANPGETLIWPVILSGGTGPYAITVDWGDGKQTDIFSQEFAGTFDISHVYDSPGIYTIIVRAADKNKQVAFLQLIGIANGQAKDSSSDKQPDSEKIRHVILWQPLMLALILIILAFWLGRRHELQVLRKKLEKK